MVRVPVFALPVGKVHNAMCRDILLKLSYTLM